MSWQDITGDPDAGKSNEHDPKEKARTLSRGVGRSNVQMVVLTPDGRLLHAVTGYIAPKELLFELKQALASWTAVKKAALTAELALQRRALVVRQQVIQDAWYEAFRPGGKKAARGRDWISRQAEHDREVLREHPLKHAGLLTTRMLTGGPGTHFGYGSGDDGDAAPTVNEIRRRIGAPTTRETEAQKRLRKRREADRARNGGATRTGSAGDRAAGGRVTGGQGGLRK